MMDSDTVRQVASSQLSMKIQTHLWVFLPLIQIHVAKYNWETWHESKHSVNLLLDTSLSHVRNFRCLK